MSPETRNYIDPVQDKEVWGQLRVLVAEIAMNAPKIIHGYHTCVLESFNSARTADTPKRIEYYKTWVVRCKLAFLRYHIGYDYLLQTSVSHSRMTLLNFSDKSHWRGKSNSNGNKMIHTSVANVKTNAHAWAGLRFRSNGSARTGTGSTPEVPP
jgi:hypothetical protein